MSENHPPTSLPADAKSNAITATSPPRGVPYYEKLRRDLRDTIAQKRLLDKNLATLEDQIHRFETSYLEETTAGNIIKGFDGYIKSSSMASSAGGGGRKKAVVNENDRVFSRSSVGGGYGGEVDGVVGTPGGGGGAGGESRGTTPGGVGTGGRESGVGTPTSANGLGPGIGGVKKKGGANKKEKDRKGGGDGDDDGDETGGNGGGGGARKRARVSFGGGRGGD